MKKIATLSVLALSTLILSGCGSSGSTKSPSVTPQSQGSSSQNQNIATPQDQGTKAESNTVNIQNFAFNPGTLTIKKGATVTWTNNDSAPHQIKSGTFNSNLLDKGQTFSFTFSEAGTFDYSCSIHPSMMGKIIVQ